MLRAAPARVTQLVARRLDDIEGRFDRKMLGILELLKKMNAAVASQSSAAGGFV